LKRAALKSIDIYQRWISQATPGACRFYPTCSAYAYEAINLYGLLKGGLITTRRISKCHPLHPGGYDPVPVNTTKTVSNSKSQKPFQRYEIRDVRLTR